MPTIYDFLFLAALFVFVAVIDTRVFVPRFKAAVAAGVPGARRRAYRRTIIGQWVVSAVVIVIWFLTGRSWVALGVLPARDWRLIVGAAFILAAISFGVTQLLAIRRIVASPEKRAKYAEQLESLAYLLPKTADEARWFLALSITAGICEELLVRGYLVWTLRAPFGLPAAVLLSVVLFGVAHAYQGAKGILKTGIVGLVMNAIVLLSGWLAPAMLFHSIIDATSGRLGYAVHRDHNDAVLNDAD